MGHLEAVYRDGFCSAGNVQDKVLVVRLQDLERAGVGTLERSSMGIYADIDKTGGGEVGREVFGVTISSVEEDWWRQNTAQRGPQLVKKPWGVLSAVARL